MCFVRYEHHQNIFESRNMTSDERSILKLENINKRRKVGEKIYDSDDDDEKIHKKIVITTSLLFTSFIWLVPVWWLSSAFVASSANIYKIIINVELTKQHITHIVVHFTFQFQFHIVLDSIELWTIFSRVNNEDDSNDFDAMWWDSRERRANKRQPTTSRFRVQLCRYWKKSISDDSVVERSRKYKNFNEEFSSLM